MHTLPANHSARVQLGTMGSMAPSLNLASGHDFFFAHSIHTAQPGHSQMSALPVPFSRTRSFWSCSLGTACTSSPLGCILANPAPYFFCSLVQECTRCTTPVPTIGFPPAYCMQSSPRVKEVLYQSQFVLSLCRALLAAVVAMRVRCPSVCLCGCMCASMCVSLPGPANEDRSPSGMSASAATCFAGGGDDSMKGSPASP
jgi:hypothetical protein